MTSRHPRVEENAPIVIKLPSRHRRRVDHSSLPHFSEDQGQVSHPVGSVVVAASVRLTEQLVEGVKTESQRKRAEH